MAKKQDQAQSAMRDMISKGKQEPQPSDSGYRTISVGLTADELAEVEAIAAELGQARHAVLKYAVLDFVRRYKAGEGPEYETVKVLKTST
jgi:hypothetical protein